MGTRIDARKKLTFQLVSQPTFEQYSNSWKGARKDIFRVNIAEHLHYEP
jgi:hypothetical protein